VIKGKLPYSAKKLFNNTNTFILSDIHEKLGHKIIDVTKMKFNNSFDIILCLNVLEHVYDYQKGVNNIYSSLKHGGTAIFFVPCYYPLHDEPNDYWRFTEHSLRKILNKFKFEKFEHSGIRQYPFAYYIEAKKEFS